MKEISQVIQDPDSEGEEIRQIFHAVGDALREASKLRGKSGLSYAEFKANFLRTAINRDAHEKASS